MTQSDFASWGWEGTQRQRPVDRLSIDQRGDKVANDDRPPSTGLVFRRRICRLCQGATWLAEATGSLQRWLAGRFLATAEQDEPFDFIRDFRSGNFLQTTTAVIT